MYKLKLLIPVIVWLLLASCNNQNEDSPDIIIPNGDFENWDESLLLGSWITNSCPMCDPPFETYIVQQDTNAYEGKYAAKMIYNFVYPAYAEQKFAIEDHPTALEGHVKADITAGDTTSIRVVLFKGNTPVDSGSWAGTISIKNYQSIYIPISQYSTTADSAYIKITGGSMGGTLLQIDQLILHKEE